MLPTLEPGWFLLMDPSRVPSKGQIVVARHPDGSSTVVVKRVQRILEDASLWVLSDNTESGTDSRHFGPIEAGAVLGVVTMVLDRPRQGVF